MYGTEKYVRDAEKAKLKDFNGGDAYDKAKRFDEIMALAFALKDAKEKQYLAEMLDGAGANEAIDRARHKMLDADWRFREAIEVELLRRGRG